MIAREVGRGVDRAIRMRPRPEVLANLVAPHGIHAARKRWWWLHQRTLSNLARVSRRRADQRRVTRTLT